MNDTPSSRRHDLSALGKEPGRAGINQTLGTKILDSNGDTGWMRVQFEAKPEFENGRGVIQGGILTAMLDNVMSLAIISQLAEGDSMNSLEIKTTFIAPGLAGTITGEGQVIKLGRSVAFTEGKLFGADGGLVATASMTAKISRKR